MPFWIRRPAEATTATARDIDRAHERGQVDVDRAYERGQVDAKKRDSDIDAAYERGRRDERASRKRHPVIMSALFVLAAAGAALITLAAVNGSFSDGGEVADRSLDTAAERATPVVQEAVQDAGVAAGEAARNAGEAIRQTDRDLAKD